MKTIIVWYRNDLRIHDNPALSTADEEADQIIPVFILDDAMLADKNASANRNHFLLECLHDLRSSLERVGSNLIVAHGNPEKILIDLCKKNNAVAVYYTSDFNPLAIKRDKSVKAALTRIDVEFRGFPGRLAVSSLNKLTTKAGTPYKVFTPFWNNWQQVGRRDLAVTPKDLPFPNSIIIKSIPTIDELINSKNLSPNLAKGGETTGRALLKTWLETGVDDYDQNHNDLGIDATSRLSPYLHFGCLSAREIETMLAPSNGAHAWRRQLAWREFYHYILFNFPDNKTKEFQERYRGLTWEDNTTLLQAWKDGQTGYPIVDAAMRQLKLEGWMHNRGRLIVGSFLTKDLGIDWREGEAHFMQWLVDGDTANNNGNWQWIASVGVDPAPLFRRLYNPSSQQKRYDPNGEYVRRYVPELKKVSDKNLSEPWLMSSETQEASDCIIGKDYPAPIVDHKIARKAALERYRSNAQA